MDDSNNVILSLDSSALDEAIKKAEKLKSLLTEVNEILQKISPVNA